MIIYKENDIFKDLIEINKLIENLTNIEYYNYTCTNNFYKEKDKLIKEIIKKMLIYILSIENSNKNTISFHIKKENIGQFEMMIF
jgi:hypothetical protein